MSITEIDTKTKEVKKYIRAIKESHLPELDLSNLKLLEIPDEVFELIHIKRLFLCNLELIVDESKMRKLPKKISLLENLEILDLRNNSLEEFPKDGDGALLFYFSSDFS
jgi:Leucine-rich repeat (LRR) protein